jgi:phosphopantetheinyl transferase
MEPKTLLILTKYEELDIQLNESILKYCSKYKDEKHKKLSLFGYKILTIYLHKYFEIDLLSKEIHVNDDGKPFFDGFNFNISNTGDFVLIGISLSSQLGVDVDSLNHIKENEKAVKAYLNIDEQFDYYNSKDPDLFLLEAWCKKEAFAKFTGKGLSICPISHVIMKKAHLYIVDFDLCIVCYTDDINVELINKIKQ